MSTRYGKQNLKQTFTQSELLKQLEPLYSGSETDPASLEMISGGICYMLSMEWIRQLIVEKPGPPASIFNNDFTSQANLDYFKQVANNYCTFSGSYDYTFFSAVSYYPSAAAIPKVGRSIMESVDRHFTELCSNGNMEVAKSELKNAPNLAGAQFKALQKEHGMMLWLQVYGSGETFEGLAHEMALWRTAEDVLYFFDSNEGVFEVNDTDRLAEEIFSYTGSFPIITKPWLFVSEIQASQKKDTGAK